MFNKKKAQGNSITTIIIAAIALVVLVILVAIFTGKISWFVKETNKCESQSGICLEMDTCTSQNLQVVSGTDCKERYDRGDAGVEGPACCRDIGLGSGES